MMINKNKANLTLIKTDCNLFTKCGKNFQSFLLTTETTINYIKYSLAKSKAERGNSNTQKADNNTPLSACFFMRKSHTPKIDLSCDRLCSMVACDGQRLIVGCFPFEAVFHPVARYRPKAWKLLAVTLKNYQKETAEMIYQFLGISRQHYDQTKAEQIRILADNETQARAYLARDYVLISLGRLPNTAKNDRTLTVKGGVYA
ncbi:host cell division inhibitor Icd-like protein [Pasteurella multocida]|uniref:host cell division inhibitor Icd-like protein n=1 Tax=Pasteurella multocida TaxID=747 RepID=UPI00397CE670